MDFTVSAAAYVINVYLQPQVWITTTVLYYIRECKINRISCYSQQ